MPRKSKIEPERLNSQAQASEPEPEIEPEGAQDMRRDAPASLHRLTPCAADDEEETQEEIKQEIKQEVKPEIKPKRILTEKQLENLKKAREAAVLKKRELKELAQKAKALPKKEIEVKAAEYDK